jgi:bacillithiol system protein YtxJ
MENHFKRITDKQMLADLIGRSNAGPIVIFKHSITCSASATAYGEMARVPAEVALVEVQSARELSREIEALTGVEHESPQVIILRNGMAVWHASHWKIRAAVIEQAVRDAA